MSLLINFSTLVILIFSTKFENVVAYSSESFLNSDVELRIVGGTKAKDAQFPYAAGIITTSREKHLTLCGGSLISTTSVLTAGHCVAGQVSAFITLGARNITRDAIEPKKQIFISTRFIIHPNFNGSIIPYLNDLAIIKLNRPAILDTHVKIIHIPANDNEDYAKKSGTTMGWGQTTGGRQKASTHSLLYQSNTILTNAGCYKIATYLKTKLLDTHMCQSGKEGKGTCIGDSGGPLVVNKTLLVGVLSVGRADCEEGQACVFTRLSKYIEWINNNAN